MRHLTKYELLAFAVIALTVIFLFLHSTPLVNTLYTNTTFGFSFELPHGFTVYPPDAAADATTTGEALVFDNGTESAELEITPYQYSDTTLTLSDVLAEEPFIGPTDVEALHLPSGVDALSFTNTTADNIGQTQLWFLSKGYLYQFTAAANEASLLRTLGETFKPLTP